MSEARKKADLRVVVAVLAIVAGMLLPLYVLSSGPAIWVLSDSACETTYSPLRVIHHAFPQVGQALDAYDNWWLQNDPFERPHGFP